MIKYNLFVGSNNSTKELESEKIIKIVSEYYKGFSCYEILGYWEGKSEKALKIEIAVEDTDINKLAVTSLTKELKMELEQDSIMVEKVNSVISFN